MVIMTIELQTNSSSNIVVFKGAAQGSYPQVAVPHWLDYNPSVGLDGTFYHVPARYEWAQTRHLASNVPGRLPLEETVLVLVQLVISQLYMLQGQQ